MEVIALVISIPGLAGTAFAIDYQIGKDRNSWSLYHSIEQLSNTTLNGKL